MIHKTALLLSVTAVIALLASTATVEARPSVNPEAIAKATAAAVSKTAEAAVEGNRRTAVHSVAVMAKLVEADKPGAAVKVGKAGLKKVNARSAAAVRAIGARCAKAVRVLNRLGAEEVADRLTEHCKGELVKVEASRRRAVEAIGDAFPVTIDDDDSEENDAE